MLVTINTDASFDSKFKVGAYAFWAVSNNFKITRSGVFKTKCYSPDDAESRCLINALALIIKNHPQTSKIIVNSDSLNAIAILTEDRAHIKRYMKHREKNFVHIQKAFSKIFHKKSTSIEFRHVKAHTTVSDSRTYVNDWCDKEAKSQLKNHISKTQKNKK